ncbi:hypothetical protein PR001_g10411 [Phytophthora rubi]|uniref:DUF6818 domain-containing protein n=1 Tax=Phytophthora rubi TaxID=129364 RepID=A0A6A3MUI6_9STRA|nr:hypothetical protein PR001_g10411 [Phytophthora rubi]
MFSFLSQSPATPPKQRVRSSQTSLQHPQSSVDAARCVKGSRLSRQASSADRLSSGSRVKRALCASGAEDEYGAAKTRKIATPFSEIAPSFPWLRSGRRFSHRAVVEAATMQVKSLRDFTRADADRIITPSSSARTPECATSQTSTASCPWTPQPSIASQTSTATDPWTPLPRAVAQSLSSLSARTPERATSQTSTASCPWTPEPPRASQTSTATDPWTPPPRVGAQALPSPSARTPERATSQTSPATCPRTPESPSASQTSTATDPWTPQPRAGARASSKRVLLNKGRGGVLSELAVPRWFAESFESDGYDTDALDLIADMPRTGRPSEANSVASSPGFALVGDTSPSTQTSEWVPAQWPADVTKVATQFNPRNWKFPKAMIGRGGRAGYQVYGVGEQLLLCRVVNEFKPIDRSMWELVATEYNRRHGRIWLERDSASLKRKFRSLYIQSKPAGIDANNGEVPPQMRIIALAQDAQRRIELKSGALEGFNRGYDDD